MSCCTPQGPKGYADWHEWAKEKSKTHKQVKCPVCNRYTEWVLKTPPTEEQVNNWVALAIGEGVTRSADVEEAKKEFTCFNCSDKNTCELAWDAYNTGGDCLASK